MPAHRFCERDTFGNVIASYSGTRDGTDPRVKLRRTCMPRRHSAPFLADDVNGGCTVHHRVPRRLESAQF
jgi:hypothetical protein